MSSEADPPTARSTAVYTHGHHDSVVRSHRQRTAANSAGYLLDDLHPGLRLLDVGCGPGSITVDLAEIVAPGRVTAVETSEAALDLARDEAARRECKTIDFVVADVADLQFADDAFDVVHAHQLLQHVADPVGALREMRRVTRPGGIVAARDGDYAAFAWYPPTPEFDEWLRLYHSAARRNGGEPDAGRRLLAWARQAGFEQVTASTSTWLYADEAGRHFWGHSWAERIVESAIGHQLVDDGDASEAELRSIASAFRSWADDPDGWFSLLHGEIRCVA